MIEETAVVKRVDDTGVWVETQRRSTCSSCAARSGCGTSVIAKVLGNRRSVIRVISKIVVHVGDQVVIGIDERALVRGSLAVYALPILLLLLGAVFGELGAKQGLWTNAELASIVFGILGLASGLYWLRRFTQRIINDEQYQPIVIRR